MRYKLLKHTLILIGPIIAIWRDL